MEMNQGTKGNSGSDDFYYTNALGLVGWLIAMLLLVIVALILDSHIPQERKIPEQPAFERAADQAVFQRLLAKHGLQHDVSLIYEDHLGRYFIRDGQRCPFK